MPLRAFVLDTETSGIGPEDKVCEIAWIEIDEEMQVLDRQHSLIDPQRQISASASGTHSITNADVVDAPTIEEFFGVVLKDHFASDDEVLLIAHNSGFDRRFVKDFIPVTLEMCTLRLARRAFPEVENHKLSTLMYALNLTRGKSHSADGDVDTCFDLLRKICERLGRPLQELLNINDEPIFVEVMPFGKHKGTKIRNLPLGYQAWLVGLDNLDKDMLFTLDTIAKERTAGLRR